MFSFPRRSPGLPSCLLAAALGAAPLGASAWATTAAPSELPDAPGLQQGQNPPKPADTTQGNTKEKEPAPVVTPAPAPGNSPKTNYDLKQAEQQRILGIMPEFQAVNNPQDLAPLTPKEKFHLMWKSSTDGFIFALDAIVAGIGQAKDSNPGYGQGAEGYFKRFGASYADTLDGNFWGNAVLTSLLHEDPRYFRKGEDFSPMHRALYSAATAVWCRRDKGTWGPNYANILGNIISGGISNIYYPAADRGVGKTFTGALTVTAEGTVGSELIEFWPDIERRIQHAHQRKLERQAAAAAAKQ